MLAFVVPGDVDPFGEELANYLRQVEERNPSIASARIEAEAAGVDVRSAKWQRAPNVALEGAYYGVQGRAPNNVTPRATVDMPIWSAGRISGVIQRASALRDAAAAGLQEVRQELTLQAIEQYFEYKRLSARIDTIDQELVDLQAMQDAMERRTQQGVSANSDLALARTRTLQVRMMRDAFYWQRQSSLQRLREYAVDPTFTVSAGGLSPALVLRGELEDMIQTASARDPRRRRIEAEAVAAQASARTAAAARFPALNVQYSYDDIYRHRLGLALKVQGTGLAEFSAARAARLREDAAHERTDAVSNDLRTAIINDYVNYASARARLDVAVNSSTSSEDVKASYMRQFAAGKRSWFDVMNAAREAMTARLDAIDLRYGAGIAQLRLLVRLGATPKQ
ncbi:MAG: TolC family protein [Sphingomonadales bacterium]